MKIPVNVYLNDEAHEYLLNLSAQGFYGKAYDFIMQLTIAFQESLQFISATTLIEEIKKYGKEISKTQIN
jgi:hypothetical protein